MNNNKNKERSEMVSGSPVKMISPSCAFLVFLLAVHGASASAPVGDESGWAVPTNQTFYKEWSGRHAFSTNTLLVFNFNTGTHDVMEVAESSYNKCSSEGMIRKHTVGPAAVQLSRAGDYFFICGFPGHCAADQKMRINVLPAEDSGGCIRNGVGVSGALTVLGMWIAAATVDMVGLLLG